MILRNVLSKFFICKCFSKPLLVNLQHITKILLKRKRIETGHNYKGQSLLNLLNWHDFGMPQFTRIDTTNYGSINNVALRL